MIRPRLVPKNVLIEAADIAEEAARLLHCDSEDRLAHNIFLRVQERHSVRCAALARRLRDAAEGKGNA